MRRFQALVLLSPLLLLTTRASEVPAIQVPTGAAITPDGQWGEAEWSKATTAGDAGVQVSFQATDGFLQVGLRSSPLFVASLCVERGNEIHIFHASSALGHAIYVRENGDEEWSLSRKFEWRLRRKDIGADVENARNDHRLEHGWVANTIEMDRSDGVVEFQIATAYFADSPARIALGLFLRRESPSVEGWPHGPDEDACTTRSVIAGPLPERATFAPSRWTAIELVP